MCVHNLEPGREERCPGYGDCRMPFRQEVPQLYLGSPIGQIHKRTISLRFLGIRGVLGNKCAGRHNLKTVHFKEGIIPLFNATDAAFYGKKDFSTNDLIFVGLCQP
jgi:hypothetical protein